MKNHRKKKHYLPLVVSIILISSTGTPQGNAFNQTSTSYGFQTPAPGGANPMNNASDQPSGPDSINAEKLPIPPLLYSGQGYKLNKLRADVYVQSGQVVISGLVKNEQNLPLRGYVIIMLLDSNGGMVKSVESEINKNKHIPPRQTGIIDAVAMVPISSIRRIAQVSVEFVKQN